MHICARRILLAAVLQVSVVCRGQSREIRLTLKDAIQQSTHSSLDYKKATNTAKSSYWNFQSYKSAFLPKLSLSGDLPDYYRTINILTLPNGTYDFVPQNVASSRLNLNLTQDIGLTGGTIAVGSSLQRIDNLGKGGNRAYTSVPFVFTYLQNNLFYNNNSWAKKIEPLKYQEAQKELLETQESIACVTVDKYFNLLLALLQVKLDEQNLHSIDTLVRITKARYDIGTMQLNDVLHARVSLLNARKSLSLSILTLKNAQQQFILYLNMDRRVIPVPEVPEDITFFSISPDTALAKAAANRKYPIEYKRRRLEAEQAIAKIRSQTGPSMNLTANLGLTQTGQRLSDSYTALLRNQAVSVGFNIPLLDWGVNRSNRRRAEANLALENNNIEQGQIQMEQEVNYNVLQWQMQEEQMSIAREANDLALQRYNIAKEKYAAGAISLIDFNNAQQEKDQAAIGYLDNLHIYWSLYFTMRKITLYDFQENKDISITSSH